MQGVKNYFRRLGIEIIIESEDTKFTSTNNSKFNGRWFLSGIKKIYRFSNKISYRKYNFKSKLFNSLNWIDNLLFIFITKQN